MPKVIAFEPSDKFDARTVQQHGKLTYLFTPNDEIPRPSIFSHHLQEKILDRLIAIGYDPETDLILLTGSYVAVNRMVGVAAAYYGEQPMSALGYDGVQHQYVIVRLNADVVAEAA